MQSSLLEEEKRFSKMVHSCFCLFILTPPKWGAELTKELNGLIAVYLTGPQKH